MIYYIHMTITTAAFCLYIFANDSYSTNYANMHLKLRKYMKHFTYLLRYNYVIPYLCGMVNEHKFGAFFRRCFVSNPERFRLCLKSRNKRLGLFLNTYGGKNRKLMFNVQHILASSLCAHVCHIDLIVSTAVSFLGFIN